MCRIVLRRMIKEKVSMRKNLVIAIMLLGLLLPLSIRSADAIGPVEIMKKISGVVLGVGAGPAVGGARGFTKGWLWGTDATAEALGDPNGVPHKIIGFATGGVLGAAAGGVAGVLMGAYDGVQYGWDSPWTKENFSWGGSGFTDYDPFKW